ncbi:MAG: prepilin-type N-terminal cleavage/methylation domain-containing protein [Actinobacteria bacterium]|nr:prepilin-type N-terminal cleavage/methylation domain-containing protein [Actinomycetota bacterium]
MLKHLKSQDDFSEKSLGAKGFTLIELLVVIVILGILAAVVVFAVSGINDRGQESACVTEARTVRTAQEAYYAENGTYAVAGAGLVPGFLSKTPTLVTDTSTAGAIALAWAGDCVGTASTP